LLRRHPSGRSQLLPHCGMFQLARRRGCPRDRQSSRGAGILVGACVAAVAFVCHSATQAAQHLLALRPPSASPDAFALVLERGAAARPADRLRGGRCRGDVSTRAKGFGSTKATKGFAAAGTSEVAAPAGGWPTLSVVLLNADSKVASQVALQQLAAQDYPSDRIQEVVVLGAAELSADAPEALRPLLKDFGEAKNEALGLKSELQACTGDVVAFWGDDHVSTPSRLRTQVAAVMSGQEAASVLQPNWFFDPVSSDFLRVRKWPTTELQEAMEAEEAALPDGFAELMVCADPLTLCGKRDALMQVSGDLEPASAPSDELKDLMLRLLRVGKPAVIRDLTWAAVRSPPSATLYEPATPDKVLVQIAEAAWPRGSGKARAAFGALLEEMKQKEMKPVEAVDRLLSEDVTKPLKQFDLERIRKAVTGTLAKATPSETSAAILEMLTWQGLVPGQGDAQAARNFPVFFATFQAIRSHVAENADFYDMVSLATIAEGIVKLATTMWATDARVNEVLAMILARELIGADMREISDKTTSTADVVGTLGLRDTLESMAYAAMDMPGEKYPVGALVNLAWAMGQGGIENGPLQMKVAKGIIGQVDKLTPPDIGKLFIVIHEQKWFKDDNTIRYLLECMMSQIKVLKQNDPGLAKILAAAQA